MVLAIVVVNQSIMERPPLQDKLSTRPSRFRPDLRQGLQPGPGARPDSISTPDPTISLERPFHRPGRRPQKIAQDRNLGDTTGGPGEPRLPQPGFPLPTPLPFPPSATGWLRSKGPKQAHGRLPGSRDSSRIRLDPTAGSASGGGTLPSRSRPASGIRGTPLPLNPLSGSAVASGQIQ